MQEMEAAFEVWCSHQRQIGRLRRGSSEAVYRAMWQALTAWCIGQRPPVDLAGLRAPVLAAYLASRSGIAGPDAALTPRYQWRLLSLVRWVQSDHAVRRRGRSASGAAELIAARPAVRRANAADRDDPPAHLLPADAARLQALLCDPAPLPRWQDLRDRCAAALQLGAGLGPGDLRALRLADVVAPLRGPSDTPWQLRVPASGSAPAHVAPVAPWAGELLQRWLAERRAQQLGGDWLLPSTRSGKPWGKVAQYESARRVLTAAGLDADHGGSFKLRHSFALRQLQAGHDPADVARWLGVVDPSVMLRYQQQLGNGAPPPAPPRLSPPV
ncbi:MAG: site-specific integrase [Burkholderiaceae bacterium]|nr:site-specific integrase [Burkholderiaceae bacterium]